VGDKTSSKRARHTCDLPGQEIQATVYSDSCGRRQQIQRHVFRFLGCVFFAVTVFSADDSFSHKKHASLKLKCTGCHDGTTEPAQFPKVEKCRVCHTEMAEQKIPSRRVYQLPEWIFFSHARHNKSDCSVCHGDVSAKDVLAVERPLKMANCISCHRENHGTQRCNVCHELGR
jgi:hypothetical protein